MANTDDSTAERLEILQTLTRLPEQAHDLVDSLLTTHDDPALAIRSTLGCSAAAAQMLSIYFRVLTPAAQTAFRVEISELEAGKNL